MQKLKVVMYCGGLPFNGETIFEQGLGGSETAAYYMAKELVSNGHQVTLFTEDEFGGIFDGVSYSYVGEKNQDMPLGQRFHQYAANTPHDVLILQRIPEAFNYIYAAKIKLLWLHDLVTGDRVGALNGALKHIDGILAVSSFHKNQIHEVSGIDKDFIHVVPNGVDLDLFKVDSNPDIEGSEDKINIIYSSRPERGLEHLVKPGGVMEKLGDKYHLHVCYYDNTTQQMAPYYDYLNKQCEKLDNVFHLASMPKADLAAYMMACDICIIPTPGPLNKDFDETFCITAVEGMAANLSIVSTTRGAVSEVTKGAARRLVKVENRGVPTVSELCNAIKKAAKMDSSTNYSIAEKYSWGNSYTSLESAINKIHDACTSRQSIIKHMYLNSDIAAIRTLFPFDRLNPEVGNYTSIEQFFLGEVNKLYDFAFSDNFEEHYKEYYEYEKKRGVDYGPEKLDGNMRYEFVKKFIKENTIPGDKILDYGCAHGHYTINLAKAFPNREFIGVDISESNIKIATEWASEDKVSNVLFVQSSVDVHGDIPHLDIAEGDRIKVAIVAEVLEHVNNPKFITNSIEQYLSVDGKIILTTPIGPWEEQGYIEHYPWRAHIHHFEKKDLFDLWGLHDDFKVVVAPSGMSQYGHPLGSYITTYTKGFINHNHIIDYNRKLDETIPMIQTVSACLIVKDAEDTVLRCLNSIADVADEIIIGYDNTTTDKTSEMIKIFSEDNHKCLVRVFPIEPAIKTGFDEARNATIDAANGDWILWVDSDEALIDGKNLLKNLSNNYYDSFGIGQHHFSIQPAGLLKTDYPNRVFRNNIGVKFYGVVHEHPCFSEDEFISKSTILHDVHIAHAGYTTEDVRKSRFYRNLPLIARDRRKYPNRTLGKFLWLRDLNLMAKCEYEQNQGMITDSLIEKASTGVEIWESFLHEGKHLRFIVEGLEFYSPLARMLGGDGFECSFKLNANINPHDTSNDQGVDIKSFFTSKKIVDELFCLLTKEKVKDYGRKYF